MPRFGRCHRKGRGSGQGRKKKRWVFGRIIIEFGDEGPKKGVKMWDWNFRYPKPHKRDAQANDSGKCLNLVEATSFGAAVGCRYWKISSCRPQSQVYQIHPLSKQRQLGYLTTQAGWKFKGRKIVCPNFGAKNNWPITRSAAAASPKQDD
jgi:hypothetical protein